MRMKFVVMSALVAFVAGSVWAGCGSCPGDAKKEAAGAGDACKVMCKDKDPEACKAECAKAAADCAKAKTECAAKTEKKCCGSDACKAKCEAKMAACQKACAAKACDKEAKAEAASTATETKAEAK